MERGIEGVGGGRGCVGGWGCGEGGGLAIRTLRGAMVAVGAQVLGVDWRWGDVRDWRVNHRAFIHSVEARDSSSPQKA